MINADSVDLPEVEFRRHRFARSRARFPKCDQNAIHIIGGGPGKIGSARVLTMSAPQKCGLVACGDRRQQSASRPSLAPSSESRTKSVPVRTRHGNWIGIGKSQAFGHERRRRLMRASFPPPELLPQSSAQGRPLLLRLQAYNGGSIPFRSRGPSHGRRAGPASPTSLRFEVESVNSTSDQSSPVS